MLDPTEEQAMLEDVRHPVLQKGVDEEGIPTKLKLHIGEEDPTRNTVVTDGKGGMTFQISTRSKFAPEVIRGGIEAHEKQHINDFLEYGTNFDVLKGQPKGKVILFSPASVNKSVLEKRGYRVEINYFENVPSNSDQKLRVDMRLKILYEMYDRYNK